MPESIGSVSVQVIADYSKMVAGFQTAQAEAQKAGSSIATSFTQAASGSAAFSNGVTNASAATSKLTSTVQGVTTAQTAATGATNAHAAALSHQVSQLQATSASIRTLGGDGGLRAVENFIAKTLGLGPAMQAIFPIIGGIAFAEILGQMAVKVYDFYQRASQGAERAKGEFREFNLGLETTNDQLQLSNDKLDNQIAKLTGKRQNAIKEMIDEAAVAADRLAERIDGALKGLIEIIKKEKIGFEEAIFTNQGPTSKFGEELGGKSGLGGKRAQIGEIEDTARAQIAAARAANDLNAANNARLEARNKLEEQYRILLRDSGAELSALESIQKLHNKGGANSFLFPDNAKNIEVQKATDRSLRTQMETSMLEFEHVGKEQTKTILEAGKEASEAEKKAAADWLRAQQEAFEDQRFKDGMTIEEEQKFWLARIGKAQAGGDAYKEALRTIQRSLLSLSDQQRQELKRSNAEDLEGIEDSIKEAQAAAAESGGSPAKTKLDMLMGLTSSDTGLAGSTIEKLMEKIPDARRAALREATAELHKSLADEDSAWKESENRTAADTIAFFELRKTLYSNDADVVRHANEQIAAAHRKQAEELFRITDLQNKNTAAAGLADVESSKIKIQSQFDLKSVTTAQDRIKLAQALADQDARGLQIKLEQADADLQAARVKKDSVAIQRALNEQAAAQRDIDIQREASESRILKMKQQESFRGQVAKGLSGDLNQAGSSLANSFSNELVNSGKVGQVFRNALKGLEASALSTVLSAGFKAAIEASGISAIFDKLGGIISESPQIAATTANTAAVVANTAAQGAHAGVTAGAAAASTGSAIASTASSAASSVANVVAGFLPSIVGGAVGGVISGIFTLIGDAKIVSAIRETTAAVISLRNSGIKTVSSTSPSDSKKTTEDTTPSGGGFLANLFTSITGGGAMKVNVVAFSPLAPLSGLFSLFGFAEGGRPPVGVPSIVGEKGPELFIPDSHGMIIPADKTKAMLAQLSMPSLNIGVPSTPSGMFGSNAGLSNIIGGASSVTNQNTGSIGSMHFAIYDTGNPRETARQIADIMKRQSPRFSPSNLGPQTA